MSCLYTSRAHGIAEVMDKNASLLQYKWIWLYNIHIYSRQRSHSDESKMHPGIEEHGLWPDIADISRQEPYVRGRTWGIPKDGRAVTHLPPTPYVVANHHCYSVGQAAFDTTKGSKHHAHTIR